MSPITRRSLLSTAAVSGVLGGVLTRVGGTAFDPTETGGWRHPQATPGNAAAIPRSGPQRADDVDWRLRIDAPLQHRFRGLALGGETLLVPTHERVLGVSIDGERRFESEPRRERLFGGLDRRTQIDSEPRVLGRRWFVASRTSLFALDVDDGRTRWRYDLNSSIDGVVLLGNTLYLTARHGSDHALVAIAATNGERRWRRGGRLVPLAAADGLLVAARYDDGALLGIDPEMGERRWSSDLHVSAPSLRPGAVALADDTLWRVHDGRLTAADASTGESQWTVDLEGDGSSSGDQFAVADAVYVVEPDSNRLSAVELDGDPRWSRDLRGAAAGIAVAGETAYVATEDGLEAIATADGERRFRVAPADTPGDTLTPLVADGTVYGFSGDTLYGVSES